MSISKTQQNVLKFFRLGNLKCSLSKVHFLEILFYFFTWNPVLKSLDTLQCRQNFVFDTLALFIMYSRHDIWSALTIKSMSHLNILYRTDDHIRTVYIYIRIYKIYLLIFSIKVNLVIIFILFSSSDFPNAFDIIFSNGNLTGYRVLTIIIYPKMKLSLSEIIYVIFFANYRCTIEISIFSIPPLTLCKECK